MQFMDVINGRKSIRAYKTQPVPKELLKDILNTAISAPSWGNTQPWEFVVVGGDKKAELDQLLYTNAKDQKPPSTDIELPSPDWPGPCMNRLAKLLEDMPFLSQEHENFNDMFKFWNAPNAIIVYTDATLGAYAMLDVGMVIQNILLTAYDYGLGTCCEAAAIYWAPDVKECLKIPESKKLVLGIAIGYPDVDSPLNKSRTTKDHLDRFAVWEGFE